jgi:hypothetical protein
MRWVEKEKIETQLRIKNMLNYYWKMMINKKREN